MTITNGAGQANCWHKWAWKLLGGGTLFIICIDGVDHSPTLRDHRCSVGVTTGQWWSGISCSRPISAGYDVTDGLQVRGRCHSWLITPLTSSYNCDPICQMSVAGRSAQTWQLLPPGQLSTSLVVIQSRHGSDSQDLHGDRDTPPPLDPGPQDTWHQT